MASNLFFPDNGKRYDRMKQLLNDVTAIRGLALGQIESQKNTTDRLDKTCRDLMSQAGFKTIEELHKSVAATLPDKERDRYLKKVNSLKEFDNILGHTSMYIGIIGATALGLAIPIDKTVLMIDMAHDVGGRAAWGRGFRKFWTGSPREGWREMSQARRLMAENAAEALEMAGGAAPRAMRAARVLRVVGEVMEVIAKWAFILEIAVLWIQLNVEAEQRDEMRKAIKAFFYSRFSMQEQLMQVMATTSLYTAFDGYLLTKASMQEAKLDEQIITTTMKTMAEKMIQAHSPDLDKMTDETIWAACDSFNTRSEQAEKVYRADDPPKADARAWLAEQARLAAAENPEQQAEKIAGAMENAKASQATLQLPL